MNRVINIIAITHIFFASQASKKLEGNSDQALSPKSAGRAGPARSKSPSSPIDRLKKDHKDRYVPEKQVSSSGLN